MTLVNTIDTLFKILHSHIYYRTHTNIFILPFFLQTFKTKKVL